MVVYTKKHVELWAWAENILSDTAPKEIYRQEDTPECIKYYSRLLPWRGMAIALWNVRMIESGVIDRDNLSTERSGGFFGFGESFTYWHKGNEDKFPQQIPGETYDKLITEYDKNYYEALRKVIKELLAIKEEVITRVNRVAPSGPNNPAQFKYGIEYEIISTQSDIQMAKRNLEMMKVVSELLKVDLSPHLDHYTKIINALTQRLKAIEDKAKEDKAKEGKAKEGGAKETTYRSGGAIGKFRYPHDTK